MHEQETRWTHLLRGLLGDPERHAPRAAPDARARLAETSIAVARLAAGFERQPPPRELRGRMLASLDPRTPLEGLVDRLQRFFDVDADHARELLRDLHDPAGAGWAAGLTDGQRFLPIRGGARRAALHCCLVYLEAGAVFPRHRHHGEEWCFNLEGRAREDNGVLWQPGDLLHWSSGSCHGYRALDDRPHICAVVLRDEVSLIH